MSVYDVGTVTIVDIDETEYGPIGTVSSMEVDVLTNTDVSLVQVNTGLQGPPGDQRIFPQETEPNWGPDDAGKIWIQVTGVNP